MPLRPERTEHLNLVAPENVLRAVYGKTSVELGMSEKRRDEVIAAAIFTSFRNQEFDTRLSLPADYKSGNMREDAEGIDMVVVDKSGRRKKLQIKGVYLQRSIQRRKFHQTRGIARILGRRTQRQMKRDSEELTKIMKDELKKIRQDYGGLILLIHVIADLATQTSLEIALRRCRFVLSKLRAKEVWFLRNIPVRVLSGKASSADCHAYKLIKVLPYRHTYAYSFAL